MRTSIIKCWICGKPGTTGEHIVKRSDLKSEFGLITQQSPLYFRRGSLPSKPIGSLNADILKSSSRICANCNNTHTQPHDLAWQTLSDFLRNSPRPLTPGLVVRADEIFGEEANLKLLNVHLYFLKLFGCRIISDNVPIDVRKFSYAILHGEAHPQIYLKFGYIQMPPGKRQAGISKINAHNKLDGTCVFAFWLYGTGSLAVNVMFAMDGTQNQLLHGAWHPRLNTSDLTIAAFLSTKAAR